MVNKIKKKDYEKITKRINSAKYPTNDFWHDRLRMKEKISENFDKDNNKRKEYIEELLGTKYMQKIIYFWLKDKFDINNKSKEIKNKLMNLKDDKDKNILKSFLYLKSYLKGKRNSVKKDLIKTIVLKKEGIMDSFSDGFDSNLNSFIKALLILLDNYENLIYYLLLDKAEKFSYKQHKLKSKGINISQLEEKIDINNFNEDNLKSYLGEFETYFETNKKSKLLKHLFVGDDVLKLYIQRDSGLDYIAEQEKTVFGVKTKIFIIEFIDNGKFIVERSIEDKGREIASFLINNISSDIDLEYKECDEYNKIDNIKKLVNTLIADEEPKIKLRGVELKTFKDLKGAPELSLKIRDRNRNLGDSINELEENNYRILNEKHYNNVKKIDVLFRDDKKLNWDDAHITYLYIENKGKKFSLNYSNSYLTRKETDSFRKLLSNNYDINAILK